MTGSNSSGRIKLAITDFIDFPPGSRKTGVVKLWHTDRRHQRMIERRSCAKTAFCSDVFLLCCHGWVQLHGYYVNFSLWLIRIDFVSELSNKDSIIQQLLWGAVLHNWLLQSDLQQTSLQAKIAVKKTIHVIADCATERDEWWVCVSSSWHSTSLSAIATFSLVCARRICRWATAVGENFENLYFTR